MTASKRNDTPLVQVGHLSKAHGIRGEVALVLTADSPDLIKGAVVLKPRSQGPEKRLVVEKARFHHGKLLVSFQGVATRNDAELLCGHGVFVPKDRLPPLEEDELYLSDLPGLRVFLAADAARGAPAGSEDGQPQPGREIGVIASVDVPAGQELWTIVTPDGKEILFPAVDQFVVSIDPEQGTACIDPPPGLLELYLDEQGS